MCNAPTIPVDLVVDHWNKKFGKETGILFAGEYNSWDQRLFANNGTINVCRTATGYKFTCADVPQESFKGVQTLLREFPKLEQALRPSIATVGEHKNLTFPWFLPLIIS